jgi:hypothetical protein
MASRTLRFSISSALLAAPLVLGVACGGAASEEPHTEPHTNVASSGDEEPHTNVHPEHQHENEDPTANPAPQTGTEPEPTANPAPME